MPVTVAVQSVHPTSRGRAGACTLTQPRAATDRMDVIPIPSSRARLPPHPAITRLVLAGRQSLVAWVWAVGIGLSVPPPPPPLPPPPAANAEAVAATVRIVATASIIFRISISCRQAPDLGLPTPDRAIWIEDSPAEGRLRHMTYARTVLAAPPFGEAHDSRTVLRSARATPGQRTDPKSIRLARSSPNPEPLPSRRRETVCTRSPAEDLPQAGKRLSWRPTINRCGKRRVGGRYGPACS
jgi:hypothetical protein